MQRMCVFFSDGAGNAGPMGPLFHTTPPSKPHNTAMATLQTIKEGRLAIRKGNRYMSAAHTADAGGFTGAELDEIRARSERLDGVLLATPCRDARARVLITALDECISSNKRWLHVRGVLHMLRHELSQNEEFYNV